MLRNQIIGQIDSDVVNVAGCEASISPYFITDNERMVWWELKPSDPAQRQEISTIQDRIPV